MRIIKISLGLTFMLTVSAIAQSDPKREACLKEAQAKGLYVTGTRNPGTSNNYLAPQRKEFMMECMRRR
jgi:hypothetical protein